MKEIPTHEQILDSSSNGVIATDAGGRIIFMNQHAGKILGFDIKKSMGAYIPDVLPLTGPLVIKCLQTGQPELSQHILGKSVSLVVNISPIKPDEHLTGAVCSFQAMREFEHTAQKLESYRLLNKQLNAIFESISDGIWVCDGNGTVININNASERLNGIQSKDIIGKNVSDLVKEGLFDRSATFEVLETRRQVSIFQYVKKTDKCLLITGTPSFDEQGNIFLVVLNERDMTQLDSIRERLEQTRMEREKFREELAELSLRELKEHEIVAESKAMRQVLKVALKLSRLGVSNILILGESGTGKGLLSKFIHKNSSRMGKPFIQINCAALPESLLEAELFGYEKGAFTGAREQGKAGLFELAHEGTLFLDEIGDLPLSLQAKLLKYLDDHEVMRLGSLSSRKIDCTIIAATNMDLESLAKKRKFRQDLFYRLSAFTLRIPPLRERPEDIFELIRHFLRKYNDTYRLEKRISTDAVRNLQSYPFPGNVRELENVLKQTVVMSEGDVLDTSAFKTFESGSGQGAPSGNIKTDKTGLQDQVLAMEKEILKDAASRCKSTRELASYLLISQPTVVRKMKKHGLSG